MKIQIETIPHNSQRYDTSGDWIVTGVNDVSLLIRASHLDDWRMSAAIAVHELVESLLCLDAGVSSTDVDIFDMRFEAARQPGDISEPGDHPDSPYRAQHQVATEIEKCLISAFGLSWQEYENAVSSLQYTQKIDE